MKFNFIRIASAVLSLAWGIFPAHSLTVDSASPVSAEDFNSMWNANTSSPLLNLPAGWRVERNLTAPRRVGSWNNASGQTMYAGGVNLDSKAKNGTWNFGSDSADRAIGGLSTTVADGTRCVNVMTSIENADAAQIITGLDLSYSIEKYRRGANAAGFAVQLFTSSDGEKWTSAGQQFLTRFDPDDVTAGDAVVPVSATTAEGNLRVHVAPGQTLWLAWNISVASGTTPDKAQGLAVDDVVIKAAFAESDPGWTDPDIPVKNRSGIYLRGEVNGWVADEEWEFEKIDDTHFVLKDKIVSGAFKIGGETWTDGVNFGSNGSSVTMGVPYAAVWGEKSGNISCGGNSYPCESVDLTVAGQNAEITLRPDVSLEGINEIYAVGDFNSWNFMDTMGKLTSADGSMNFSGRITMRASADGLCHWRLYLRRAMAGVWGLAEDAAESSVKGRLLRGCAGNIATAPGTYDVVVSLGTDGTGSYSMTAVESQPAEMTLWPVESVLTPVLPDKVRILSLNNSLIHYNDQSAMFNEIASSAGVDAQWTKHTLLGKSLATHWDEGDGLDDAGMPGAKMMVRSQPWTHIILQEQSSLPRTNPRQFRANVEKWVGYIRSTCPNPNAVIILPVNWAYSGDWDNFTPFNEIFSGVYADVASEFGLVICPVMTAYQDCYDSEGVSGLAPWFQDDRHPTDLSTYMAACMEFGLIYNADISALDWKPASVTAQDAAKVRSYASAALAKTAQTVDHHSATVAFRVAVYDSFGVMLEPGNLTFAVDGDGEISSEGVFSCRNEGTYNVTVSSPDFTRSATVSVCSHVTDAIPVPTVRLTSGALEYTQDFDSMDATASAVLPTGWRMDRTDSPRTPGQFRNASETAMYAGGVNLPSNASNGTWNFGADDTDRAPGGITTGVAGGARAINIYAHLVNGADRQIESLNLSYDIEKYRDGSNPEGFSVRLMTSADGIEWHDAGDAFTTFFPASGATVGAATVPMETVKWSGVLPTAGFGRECDLYLAWNISVTVGTACNGAPALAIDNVSIKAVEKPVPQYKWHIYVDDRTGYAALGAYAYGDSELWGAWPGQSPIDRAVVDGVAYKVFGHDADSGSFKLILNNWNQSMQLPDFPFEGGRDYFLRAADGKVTEVEAAVEEIVSDGSDALAEYFNLQGMRVDATAAQKGVYIRRRGTVTDKVVM